MFLKKKKVNKKDRRKRRLFKALALAVFLSAVPVYADEETDIYDKNTTIMGVVYNEIRYLEIQWAGQIASYGTEAVNGAGDGLSLNIIGASNWFGEDETLNITFTDQQVDAKTYVQSVEGYEDGLGTWVYVTYDDETKEGILGPTPFGENEGIDLDEVYYKVLQEIDAGNTLEIRGKPQEGYTSNAKEIAAMTEVFYSQAIDAIEETTESARGWTAIQYNVTNCLRSLATYFELHDTPILSQLATTLGWSWTSMARDYAYPLMSASHICNFYLSEYLFPTRWTAPDDELYQAGGGTQEEVENARRDGSLWDEYQESINGDPPGDSSNNGDIGRQTEGGSGKIQYYTNRGTSTNDSLLFIQAFEDNIFEIDYCPGTDVDGYGDDFFDGFGCVRSPGFTYLWPGEFTTSECTEDMVNSYITEVYSTIAEAEEAAAQEAGENETVYVDYNAIETGVEIYNEDALTTLYYKYYESVDEASEPDLTNAWDDELDDESEPEGIDISADVCAFDKNLDYVLGYDAGWYYDDAIYFENSEDINLEDDEAAIKYGLQGCCIIHPTLLRYEATVCWVYIEDEKEETTLAEMLSELGISWEEVVSVYDETDPDTGEVTYSGEYKNNYEYWYDSDTEEYFRHDVSGEILYMEATDDGIEIWFGDHLEIDSDASSPDEAVVEEMSTVIKLVFQHDCNDNHTGNYCGGHLQLKTRGVVYGFSEEQMEAVIIDSDEISTYDPKYLDPVNWDEGVTINDDGSVTVDESATPSIDDVADEEVEAFEDSVMFTEEPVWLIENHTTDDDTPQISEENEDLYIEAEDIFEVDILIDRPETSYPGYNEDTGGVAGETVSTPKWRSWTLGNMGEAISLATADWKQSYNLADTQTIVGGTYETDGDYSDITAAGNIVASNILELLGYYELPTLSADLTDPEAVNMNTGEPLTAYEREWISRLRHVAYALNCVGDVSYSQLAHGYWYDDVAGRLTDCSGFASNIWRDRFAEAGVQTTATLLSDYSPTKYYWSSGTTPEEDCGISPGDIIVRDSSDNGGDHALIYIGTFRACDIYDDSDDETYYAFAVDCSSMNMYQSALEGTVVNDDAITSSSSSITSQSGEFYSIVNTSRQVEEDARVHSGNVRFAARSYLQQDGDQEGLYYIDMTDISDYLLDDIEEGEPGTYGANEEKGWEGCSAQCYAEAGGVTMAYKDSDEEQYLELLSEFYYNYTFLDSTETDYWRDHTASLDLNGVAFAVVDITDYYNNAKNGCIWFNLMTSDEYTQDADDSSVITGETEEEYDDTGQKEDDAETAYMDSIYERLSETLAEQGEDATAEVVASYMSDSGIESEYDFIFPVSGYTFSTAKYNNLIITGAENTTAPVSNSTSRNGGIDIYVPAGTDVLASDDGTVVEVLYDESTYGYYVTIYHESGYFTRYSRLSDVSVSPGDTVKQGDVIAKSGNSGDSETASLHFEIRVESWSIALNVGYYME